MKFHLYSWVGGQLGCSQFLSTGTRISLTSQAPGNQVLLIPAPPCNHYYPVVFPSCLSEVHFLHNHDRIVSYFVVFLKHSSSLLSLCCSVTFSPKHPCPYREYHQQRPHPGEKSGVCGQLCVAVWVTVCWWWDHVCPLWGELLSWKGVLDEFNFPWTTGGGKSVCYESFRRVVGSTLVSKIPFGAACLFSLFPAFLVPLIILLPRLPLREVTFSRGFRSTVRKSNSIILFFVIGGLEVRCMCKILSTEPGTCGSTHVRP